MGRHTVAADTDEPSAVPGSVFGMTGRLALVVAAVITVIGAGVLIGPRQALARLPWASGGSSDCSTQNVDLVVAPELRSLVDQIVNPVRGKDLGSGDCVSVQVRAQEPQETVASAGILPIERAPQIWIPDASIWGNRVKDWTTTSAGSLASSPVVIATSRSAAEGFGWQNHDPTWHQVLRGDRPVAVPDYQAQSESLAALLTLWQSLGKDTDADNAVVATVVASDRQEVPTPAAALSNARSGASQAPLIPATEQSVAYLNATSQVPNLYAVYPREGSMMLDYPILQVGGTTPTPVAASASAAVVQALTSDTARTLASEAGFRTPGGTPTGEGIRPDKTKSLGPLDADDAAEMIKRLSSLSKPTRILAVLDVSLSMTAKLDDGLSRTTLSAGAARLGANLLPDSSYVGVWIFASNMGGGKDYKVLAPVERLGDTTKSGESNRSHLIRLTYDPEQYLHGGGTSLYDVVSAASKYMHDSYDKNATNAIILMGDGGNEDSRTIGLPKLLAQLRAENSDGEDVAIYTAGLGPDADYKALRQIAVASGGYDYHINTALEGQKALLDGLRRSRNIGK